MSVPALLLVPNDRDEPGPAVLAQRGHGRASPRCAASTDERRRSSITAATHRLAELGYVVLAPDLRSFGERTDWLPPDKYGCDLNLARGRGGRQPARRTSGTSLAASTCWSSIHWSIPIASAWSGCRTAERRRCSLPRGTSGSGMSAATSANGESHRVPWNLCGSQVLRGCSASSRRTSAHSSRRARVARRDRHRRSHLPGGGARRWRLAVVYEALGVPERLEHDVFEGGLAGTATGRTPSSSGGCERPATSEASCSQERTAEAGYSACSERCIVRQKVAKWNAGVTNRYQSRA